LQYTVLRASSGGVVTSRKFEVGQVVAEGQPVVSIANEGEPEIVIDVPEDQLAGFNKAHFKAWLASEPDAAFDVELRELSPAGGSPDAYLSRKAQAQRSQALRWARAPPWLRSTRPEKRRWRPSRPVRSRKAMGSRRCG
jgi:multidrug resistance efflux pump